MFDPDHPEDIKMWHIGAFAFAIVVLACLAIYMLSNVYRSVA